MQLVDLRPTYHSSSLGGMGTLDRTVVPSSAGIKSIREVGEGVEYRGSHDPCNTQAKAQQTMIFLEHKL